MSAPPSAMAASQASNPPTQTPTPGPSTAGTAPIAPWGNAVPEWLGPCTDAGSDWDEPIRFHRECKERFWVSADYLVGWIRNGPLGVPLVTLGDTADINQGALGQPGTSVLFGTNTLDFGRYHGVKAQAGVWLDANNCYSLDVSGFYLFPEHSIFEVASDPAGLPLIARPVINALTSDEEAYLVSFPGAVAGGIRVDARSQLFGAELNGRAHGYWLRRLHAQGLAGFRYLRLEESLRITDRLQPLLPGVLTFRNNPVDPPDQLSDTDYFTTANTFYGFQLGYQFRWEHDWFFLDFWNKAALGVTDQQVNISGSTTVISPAGNQVAQGGILALPSNIGKHNRYVFGVVPQAGLDVGVNLFRHVSLKGGYSFLLMNNVTRPGLAIDRTVNPTQVPSDQLFGQGGGPARPAFAFRDRVFWAHVFNFGLEFHY